MVLDFVGSIVIEVTGDDGSAAGDAARPPVVTEFPCNFNGMTMVTMMTMISATSSHCVALGHVDAGPNTTAHVRCWAGEAGLHEPIAW